MVAERGSPVSKRHFPEAIALPQYPQPDSGAVAQDRDVRRASQHDEHRIALGAFLDQAFATPVTIDVRAVQDVVELGIVQAVEKRLSAQDGLGIGMPFRNTLAAPALQMERPDRERNGNALALEFVPDVGPDRVGDFIIGLVISHRELDLVSHGRLREIDHKNPDWAGSAPPLPRSSRAKERVFYPIGRNVVVDSHPDAHRMDLRRVMEIDDRSR